MKRYTFTNSLTGEIIRKNCFANDNHANSKAKEIATAFQVPVIVREERIINTDSGGNEMPVLPDNEMFAGDPYPETTKEEGDALKNFADEVLYKFTQ